MAERRIRIGNWLVDYDDATQEVKVDRTIQDVLKATPGDDQNCMNSQCIKAQRNRHVFPHPVYVVSTIKTRVYIVDRLTDSGEPAHAVRYELSKQDSRLIHEHDASAVGETGTLRLMVPRLAKGAAHPGPPSTYNPNYPQKTGRFRKPVTARGAEARFKVAVGALAQADIIEPPAKKGLSESAKAIWHDTPPWQHR